MSPGSTGQGPAPMLAGLDVEFSLSGFSPLEEFFVTYAGPEGERRPAGRGRADASGEAIWTKPTSRDAMGEWTAQVLGSTGSQATAAWTLAEMGMDAPVVASLEREFRLYHTPEARIHFDDTLFTSQVAVMAQYLADSIGLIEGVLGQDLDTIDVFLLPNGEAVQEEMVAAGSSRSSGFESGIALLGGTRPGIYIDMAAPFYSWRHIAAHELVHFVIGAIEQDRRARSGSSRESPTTSPTRPPSSTPATTNGSGRASSAATRTGRSISINGSTSAPSATTRPGTRSATSTA